MGGRTLVTAVALATALAGCSCAREPRPGFGDLDRSTADNQAILEEPVCQTVPQAVLRRMGAGGDGQPDDNPIWSGCRWERPDGGAVEVRAGTLTEINAPLFERGKPDIEPLEMPRVDRAAIVDGHPDHGICSSLLIELTDDGGFLEIIVCGADAREAIRSSGLDVADSLLDAQA